MPQGAVNPITVEVVRNGLAHIANEMATVLRKTSYNMMIYEVRDYCVGIVDPEGNILSQNFGALPIFLADLGPAIVDGVRMHGKDGFRPGDVLIMNHPYVCGQHLNNVVVYTPFFYQGELVAFLAVRAHWIDIGGTRVGFGFSGTREVYEEGLQFRSLKLYRGDEPNQDIFQIITDNVRFAESCLGDLRAQIAACRVGDRGLAALVDRYGLETFLRCVKTIWNQSEALAREQVARIKPGKYEAEALFDSDGVNLDRPVPLKVKVEVAGGEMTIDFSEISEQVPGSINSGESGAVAAARVAFKSLVAPFSPIDEGCFRPLKIVIPEGKILSATPPAPVGNWSRTLPTVIDLILKALAPAMPEQDRCGSQGRHGRLRVLRHRSENRTKVSLPDDHGWWLGRARARRRRKRHGVDVPGRRAERASRDARDLLSGDGRASAAARRQRRRRKISRRFGHRNFRARALRCVHQHQCRAPTHRAMGTFRRRERRDRQSAGEAVTRRSRQLAYQETELSIEEGRQRYFLHSRRRRLRSGEGAALRAH